MKSCSPSAISGMYIPSSHSRLQIETPVVECALAYRRKRVVDGVTKRRLKPGKRLEREGDSIVGRLDIDVKRDGAVGHETRSACIEQTHSAVERRGRKWEIDIGFVLAPLREERRSTENEHRTGNEKPVHQATNLPSDVQQTAAPTIAPQPALLRGSTPRRLKKP